MSTAGKQNRKKKASTLNARASKGNASTSHCKQGKGSQRRSKLTIAKADAAAVDVGSQVHYAAVPEGRAEQSVRSFGAYSAQLDELVQWCQDCEIKTVAMESTGVYWIPLYQKLEEAGFEVLLVDARQVKHVPGRKSDLQDCQWLQQLHSYGLLRAAFRPEDSICRLRTLQRHRKSLVECGAMWIQHIQKALNGMNLHLHHVLTDISGQSGLAILDAILAGERDPKKLASLADHRVKKSQAQIEAALTGDYRPELLFVVSQALHAYRQMQQQIAQCDLNIEKHLATIGTCAEPEHGSGQTPPPQEGAGVKARTSKRKPKDAFELSLAGSFYRRKHAHLGAPKAITATARKLGCLIYRLIKDGQAYQEPDLHTYELKYKNQILRSLRKRANGFGFDLVELPKAA